MKERSLENQYLMLEALKRRFDATEIVGPGFERARQYAGLAGEAQVDRGSTETVAENLAAQLDGSASPASPAIQPPLFEEAA